MAGMTISANHVAPDFAFRRQIHADDLKDIVEPAVLFEYAGRDADGAPFFVYTVAGWLDGENIATEQGGCTVGGDVMVINADTREQADAMACLALEDTINALHSEHERMIDAAAAQARLATVSPIDRMSLAMKPEEYPRFVEDSSKARALVGDDIILAAGH